MEAYVLHFLSFHPAPGSPTLPAYMSWERVFFFYLYFIFYFYNCITELSTCQPQFWPSRSLAPRKPISNFERFKNIVLLYKELDDTCYQSIFCTMQILFFCIFSKMHYDLEAVFWQDNLLHSVDLKLFALLLGFVLWEVKIMAHNIMCYCVIETAKPQVSGFKCVLG